jgi:hypothetical protein
MELRAPSIIDESARESIFGLRLREIRNPALTAEELTDYPDRVGIGSLWRSFPYNHVPILAKCAGIYVKVHPLLRTGVRRLERWCPGKRLRNLTTGRVLLRAFDQISDHRIGINSDRRLREKIPIPQGSLVNFA